MITSCKNDQKITLSIIIPVYNVEKYLERCVYSVSGLFNDSIEIILIDDGSTDSSGMICDNFEKTDPVRFHVIHKKNGGLSSARNTGLDVANGKYVFFLDSDDYMANGFLERIIPCLMSDLYDIIEFKPCFEKKYNTAKPKITDSSFEMDAYRYINNIITNKLGNEICFRVFRRSLFDLIRFPEGRNYEDIATCYKLIIQSKSILSLDSEFYIYNVNNNNSITKTINLQNMQDMYDSINEMSEGIRAFYQKNHIVSKDINYIEYYKRNTYIYIYLKLFRNKLLKTVLAQKIRYYLNMHNQYDLRIMKYFDMKRWLVYELVHFFKIF